MRDAPNREAVAEVVRARLGAPLTVLGGDQEAALAFAGARLGVGGDGPILVVDIGGGSTELVRGLAEPIEAISLQLGAVRQTERHLRSDPPAAAEMAALRDDARSRGRRRAWSRSARSSAWSASRAPSPASPPIELGAYDRDRVHRHVLTRATVERLAAELAALPVARRREVPGLEPARAGVIVAGAVDRGRRPGGLGRRRDGRQRARPPRRRGPGRPGPLERPVPIVTSVP